jgi:hypothetical protein
MLTFTIPAVILFMLLAFLVGMGIGAVIILNKAEGR